MCSNMNTVLLSINLAATSVILLNVIQFKDNLNFFNKITNSLKHDIYKKN